MTLTQQKLRIDSQVQDYGIASGLDYWEIYMLKSKLVEKDFQTWSLIGWQHSRQPIRSHVRISLLTNMDFKMDFSK